MSPRRLASFPGVGERLRWRFLRELSSRAHRYPVGGKRYRDNGYEEDEREKGDRRVYLHKSRGQHLLTNPRVLDAIVQKSGVGPLDTVLEVGPGTGNLTLKLLEQVRHVVAVEIDKRMVEVLHQRIEETGMRDRLTVICGDALRTEFPQFDHCVANIPYGISSPLIVKLLYGSCKFQSATLLLQREFAKRLLANPGESQFNRLAVNVKLVSDVQFLMDVSKRDFVPCPKVDSSLVRVQPKPEIPAVDLDEWQAFIRTCFSKKNKTLGAIFKQKKKVTELMSCSQRMIMEEGECGSRRDDREGYENANIFANTDDTDEEEEEELDHVAHDSTPNNLGLSLFKDKIVDLLNTSGYGEKRPTKLSIEELLSLLYIFNQAGVYFRNL